MLQRDEPDGYVMCTDVTHVVSGFCETAFGYVGWDYRDYVVQASCFYPTQVHQNLGWRPRVRLGCLTRMMADKRLCFLGQEVL